jgi:hypothetical protein
METSDLAKTPHPQILSSTGPGEVKRGSLATVKKKLKQWVLKNVPLDWG